MTEVPLIFVWGLEFWKGVLCTEGLVVGIGVLSQYPQQNPHSN